MSHLIAGSLASGNLNNAGKLELLWAGRVHGALFVAFGLWPAPKRWMALAWRVRF